MNRREAVGILGGGIAMGCSITAGQSNEQPTSVDVQKEIRIGMIGLDTSHVSAFTKLLNQENSQNLKLAGSRVVAAFPGGNPAFPLSKDRINDFTDEVRGLGVAVVDSIESLLLHVDVVMLESVDGTQHLEQARQVFAAKKPMFIDKPLAASLTDVLAIAQLGKEHNSPWFTASSSRFTEGYPELKHNSEIGEIVGCDAYSQTRAAIGHPDLFWYGVHGVDLLYSLMGTGCQSVTAIQTKFSEQVTGTWENGRVGTYRSIREHTAKTGLGVTVFGMNGIAHANQFYNYVPLVEAIVQFFRTRTTPVPVDEMVEVFAYLQAAEESKRRGGVPVTLKEVMEQAQKKSG